MSNLKTNTDKLVELISLIDEVKVDEFKALAKITDFSDPEHNGLLLTAALDHQNYHFFDVLVEMKIHFSELSTHRVLHEMLFNTNEDADVHPAFVALLKSGFLLISPEKQAYFVKAALLTYENKELARLFIENMPRAFENGDVIGRFLLKQSTDRLAELMALIPGEVKDTVANDKIYNALSTWGSELDFDLEKVSSILGIERAHDLFYRIEHNLIETLDLHHPPATGVNYL